MSSSGNNGAQKKDSNRVQEGYTPEGTPADKSPYSCRQANHCQDLESWANASQPDSSASKSRAILAQGGGDNNNHGAIIRSTSVTTGESIPSKK